MKHVAIPTLYRGIQFRSRLESKWAIFFDSLGWRWEYEPINYRGWIPDFMFRPPERWPVLVECKPIFELDTAVCQKIERALGDSSDYEVLLCGAELTRAPVRDRHDILGIGWMYHPDTEWVDSAIINTDWQSNTWLLEHWYEFFNYQDDTDLGIGTIHSLWAKATNASQWRAPR
jgi:hypothetical protein